MGWLGDIAVLGVVVLGGWWFFNNYKNLGGGGGGSTAGGEVPPLEGEPAPTGPTTNKGNPVGDQSIRQLFVSKGFPIRHAECGTAAGRRASDIKKVTCATADGHTALFMEYADVTCLSSRCGQDFPEKEKKRLKLNCQCNYPAGAAVAATTYIAHFAMRVKPRRELNNNSSGIEKEG